MTEPDQPQPKSKPKPQFDLILAAVCFLVGFAGVLAYSYWRAPKPTPPDELVHHGPIPTPQPTLALVPPSEALSGTLTISEGKADMFARNADAYAEASSGAQLLTGEAVATKDNSRAAVEIPNLVTTSMEENAEVVFASLYPGDSVLQQKNGKVRYEVGGTNGPVAVRALHSLVSIPAGDVTIHIIDTDVSVIVATGSAKLALVDRNNDTHVWNLAEGERANIDDAARQVYLLKAR